MASRHHGVSQRAFQTQRRADPSWCDSAPSGFSATNLSQARAIFEWPRTKAADVLNGVVPFDQVLKEMNGEAEKSRGNTAKITRLRDNAPDLADLVNQHRLDLECALSQTGRKPGGGTPLPG